ncbi:hypothetical protein MPTK1_7g03520 [Marchantia polymorpha subsp. ruderalis]|nr:hypothetical protein AXG93_1593s1160 [Marchantia polymorpha subsp. ruderalis]PTQ35054.1 hypothetical protein MARPO_0074s0044 [Marchantia polymorpha]BBN16112.1 hypothetical protein Mp_7g03520 [Marchantia polymorpha subsp. ruderalis]|eukprot:PTQ35054.1 hypothetical protein MARPO_0074s0044 [Marchantia polymorpha]
MQEDDGVEASTSGSSPPIDNPSEAGEKSRSCRGCLLYSSSLRDSAQNPLCIGLSRSETRVFSTMGDSERDATKDGRRLADFKYACIGYSIHKDVKNSSGKPTDGAELPLCVGVEFLADRRPQGATTSPIEQGHNDEEGPAPIMPRPQSSLRPPTTIGGMSGDEFASRFFRCAGLVASAVVKNVSTMVTSIKTGLDDIYHERRRPK